VPFEVALLGHLASLVLGFGAVLAVDWVALLWLFRQRTRVDIVRAADNARYPIWLGYAGLVATGVLLEPDLTSVATRVKLVLVLMVGLNGVLAMVLHGRLAGVVGGAPGRRLLMTAVGSATVSQAGWWGAMFVGLLNGHGLNGH